MSAMMKSELGLAGSFIFTATMIPATTQRTLHAIRAIRVCLRTLNLLHMGRTAMSCAAGRGREGERGREREREGESQKKKSALREKRETALGGREKREIELNPHERPKLPVSPREGENSRVVNW